MVRWTICESDLKKLYKAEQKHICVRNVNKARQAHANPKLGAIKIKREKNGMGKFEKEKKKAGKRHTRKLYAIQANLEVRSVRDTHASSEEIIARF